MKMKKLLLSIYDWYYWKRLEINDWLVRKVKGTPTVLTIDETIEYIIENKCSVSRYGDGELKIVCGQSLLFQEYNKELSERLAFILKSDDKNLLVCISDIFDNIDWMTKSGYDYTRNVMLRNRKRWTYALDLRKTYGNAFISRCYMDRKDKSNSGRWFQELKKIWNQQDIVIIEGIQSRLGYGNDLFVNANSIQRILCPAKNAYSVYEKILCEAKKLSKEKLILLALGPTATILAYDLNRMGHWAIDIGHVDIEYEWFLNNCLKKEKVEHKFTMEVMGGDIVNDQIDKSFEENIICKID